ncbi:XTP/dITP diphosphohydrolase [Bacillus oleivorans]|uniref:dITP/XTP pyrophosphatase n=1 Tax=Bacillus oleivorans TaxID=1448271 RepID=A0A285CVA8_9BACI|nr:XTP/dITP diphosphatase [Bacillus oleivorans]SNX71492.1 XTP/dITP diphosphohydrolase [Bacillus oleivorans]
MKEKVVIATQNKGKAKEFEDLFAPFHFEVVTLLDLPEKLDIIEDGSTFEENAIKKAETISQKYNCFTIGDDSGLIVDFLNGRPGIYSARYAGEEKNDEANIQKVLQELEGVPSEDRTARFYCALAFSGPGMKTKTVYGTCEGIILTEKRGSSGFGYDPIFYVEDFGKTLAELSKDEKNRISHRGNAIRKLSHILDDWVSGSGLT